MTSNFISVICIVLFSNSLLRCTGYNILVVFPEPTKSHGILGGEYVRLLLEAGHKVTYITPFPLKATENLEQVDISSNLRHSKDVFKHLEENYRDQEKFLQMLSLEFGRMALTHESVGKFLESTPEDKFRVVIAEWIDSELYSGFAAFFNCPLIWSVSTQLYWQPLRIMDEIPNPAYSADVNSDLILPLSFSERISELFIQMKKLWILHFTIYPEEVKIYNEVFAKSSILYEDVPSKYSMMLANTHPSVGTSWRLPPSVKEIAGYHVRESEIEENLSSILARSSYGVIYFSMGTTVSVKEMPIETREAILDVFRRLRQTVIWKVDVEIINIPPNVHLMNWVPQTSLLAHEYTKIFISHGGLLSTIEAIHYGVPTIVIPRHGDQFMNANVAVKKGFAIRLNYDKDLASNLKIALGKMLHNESYSLEAKKWSRIYHDRPVPPSSELVHWVEHVARENGSVYQRSPALDVSWFKRTYLDFILLIIGIIIATTFFVWTLCCYIRKALK